MSGGDDIAVTITLDSNKNIMYRGQVRDQSNGTYYVTYTVPRAGTFSVDVTSSGERVSACTPPVHAPAFRQRSYDGVHVYQSPVTCTTAPPTLLVVHGPLHPPTTTAVDYTDSASGSHLHTGLRNAVVGVANGFTVEARDEFGNLRRGDDTPHFVGYGDGKHDPFLVSFAGPSGYATTTSTAVQTLTCSDVSAAANGYFRLRLDGALTLDLPLTISATALEFAIMTLHPDDPRAVRVSGPTIVGTNANTRQWTVTFLSHLDLWSQWDGGLDVAPASDTSTTASAKMHTAVVASGGEYPVEFTLWVKGLHSMSVMSADGHHIEGSPFTVEVDDGATEAVTSFADGPGLSGGVAGSQLAFTVQARDVRQYEHQVVATNATVVPVVDEIQTIRMASGASGALTLSFRGASTPTATLAVGDTLQTVANALGSLDTIRGTTTVTTYEASAAPSTVTVAKAYANGVVVASPAGYGAVTAGDEIEVTFTGPRGDVPLLVVDDPTKATVVETRKGDCPFRAEVQTFTCVYDGEFGADVVGRNFTVRLRDSTPAVIPVSATLAEFVQLLAAKGVAVEVQSSNSSYIGDGPDVDRLHQTQVFIRRTGED